MSHLIDDRALSALMEESSDLHSDAMRNGRPLLAEYAATAKTAADAAILQTAASIENLAVATYGVALTLPFIGGSAANGVVKAFAMKTRAQHQDHARGFNAALSNMGAKQQHKPDPKYLAYVNSQKAGLTNAGAVVKLALALEDVAAQTYTNDVSLVSTSELRQLFAGVAGVEAQHKAILLAVQALVTAGAPQLIALPPNAAKLPKAAGNVGFPDAFFPTKSASPASEGAVK